MAESGSHGSEPIDPSIEGKIVHLVGAKAVEQALSLLSAGVANEFVHQDLSAAIGRGGDGGIHVGIGSVVVAVVNDRNGRRTEALVGLEEAVKSRLLPERVGGTSSFELRLCGKKDEGTLRLDFFDLARTAENVDEVQLAGLRVRVAQNRLELISFVASAQNEESGSVGANVPEVADPRNGSAIEDQLVDIEEIALVVRAAARLESRQQKIENHFSVGHRVFLRKGGSERSFEPCTL